MNPAQAWRPLVLPKHHRAVFQHLHGIAHPGRLATLRLISSRFVWPGLSKDVTTWARECAACQRSKIHRHFQVRPKPIPVLQRRFAHIHINLLGPLTPSNSFNHILTVIDRTSRRMEALPLANTAAAEVAAALFSGWICKFGVPAIITSDRGAQFTSNIWNSLCLLLQIKHQPTTAYHPKANGMVERLKTFPRSCGPRTATRRPSRPSTTAPTPSSSAASATSGSSCATGRTTSPPPGSSPAPAPPRCGRPRREQTAAAAPPKRIRFNLTPTPPPAPADLGTVFPGKPAMFFARPGEASSSRYPQRNRGPPAWQRDYTFFAANRDQEAGGSSVATLRKGCLRPSSHHESGA